MWLRTGTNPKRKARLIVLPYCLRSMIEETSWVCTAKSMPATHSIFAIDVNDEMIKIRCEQDYAKFLERFQPTSERTPFLLYGKNEEQKKIEQILRLGPQPEQNALPNSEQRARTKIYTGDAASYARNEGAATERATEINFQDMIMIVPA